MDEQSRARGLGTLRQITAGMRTSQALHVAAKLKIADHLARKPMRAAELATITGTDASALYRLMRALCALDVFSESSTGEFGLTPAGQMLRTDVQGSFWAPVMFLVGDVRWRCWADLFGSVRAGGGGAERTLGMELFDFYEAHPQESEIHDQAMRAQSAALADALLKVIDVPGGSIVVDVGGGTGELLAAVVAANPSIRGILFDLPHVVAHAAHILSQRGVTDRVEVVGGSFFDGVPGDGNTYLMKVILHDWDDARCTKILRNCRKAMSGDDRLLILERQIPALGQHKGSPEAFLLDLEMLVMTPGGRERTAEEFERLLAATGFRLATITPSSTPLSVFEARPV